MSTRSIMWTLMLLGAYMSAAAEPPEDVSGDLHSPLNLTTSFDPDDVHVVSWKCDINRIEKLIVKIKNGIADDDHDGYGQYNNGLVLEISNLTEQDLGLYTADVTFVNNTMKMKSFNVTVHGNLALKKNEPTTSNPSAHNHHKVLPTRLDCKTTPDCNLLGILSMVVVTLAVGLPLIGLWFRN